MQGGLGAMSEVKTYEIHSKKTGELLKRLRSDEVKEVGKITWFYLNNRPKGFWTTDSIIWNEVDDTTEK